MKKVLSLLLSLAMLSSIVLVVNYSALAETVLGSCGENITFIFNSYDGKLTIRGTGNIKDNAFAGETSIKAIVIESGITGIGTSTFSDCTQLTDVKLPNSLTNIGNCAFYNCSSLFKIEIPVSVISIGDDAFYDCYFTENDFINKSDVKTEINIVDSDNDGFCIKDNKLVKLRPSFAVGEVVVPNSVISIEDWAFYSASYTNLNSVKIPSSVKYIGDYAFYCCSNLKEITVESNNAYYFSQDGILFSKDKTELIQYPAGKSIDAYSIPNSVTSICDVAFYVCENVTSVTIPNSVTSIGNFAFGFCANLADIIISKSVTNIGEGSFIGCISLTEVYYLGSQDDWNMISIDSDNEDLIQATIHYNYNPVPVQPTNPVPVQPTAPANLAPAQSTAPAQSVGSASQGSEAEATASQAPKTTSIKKAKGAKSAISVEWKKVSGVKGYQIQVATDKKFKKNKKTVTIKKQKTTKTTVKKLKAKKKYYVRVRTYKIVNGKKVYSSWSKVKSVKTK